MVGIANGVARMPGRAIILAFFYALGANGLLLSNPLINFQPSLRGSFGSCKAVTRTPSRSIVYMGDGYEGNLEVQIRRNFGDKFFLKGRYTAESRPAPREWTFQRTYADFAELDQGVRTDPELVRRGGSRIIILPPEPYLIGEESSFEPFQKYLDQVLALPKCLSSPYIYEFLEMPNAVLTAVLPEIVVIDIEAEGTRSRYEGRTATPVLDPVMLAEKAGKQYSSINKALTEAEIAKNAGKATAEIAREGSKVLGEVTKVVNPISTGKVLGGVLGNLRAGKGIFGEQATMTFSKAVMKTAGLEPKTEEETTAATTEAPAAAKTENSTTQGSEASRKYTDQDKWTIVLVGPVGEPLEVTVRPTQKVSVLIKAWMADNGVEGSYTLKGDVDVNDEIGEVGLKDGVSVKIVKK